MSVSLKVTNTRVNPLSLFYRIPGKTEAGLANPALCVEIPARALNHEISFASEAHMNAFIAQTQQFADRGIILFGKTKESAAEKMNERVSSEEVKNVREQKAKSAEKLEKSVPVKKSKLELSVEKS